MLQTGGATDPCPCLATPAPGKEKGLFPGYLGPSKGSSLTFLTTAAFWGSLLPSSDTHFPQL